MTRLNPEMYALLVLELIHPKNKSSTTLFDSTQFLSGKGRDMVSTMLVVQVLGIFSSGNEKEHMLYYYTFLVNEQHALQNYI
jgi:hypothetical protein